MPEPRPADRAGSRKGLDPRPSCSPAAPYAGAKTGLASELDLHAFWKRYNFLYADVSAGAVPDRDMTFFSEVNDRLHYTDSASPPDPALEDPLEFTSWLAEALRVFESGARSS